MTRRYLISTMLLATLAIVSIDTADAATRGALRRIRAELERRAAQSSVQPSRVTLQGTMALTEFVEQVSLQTGNPVVIGTDDDSIRGTQIDVDYDGVLFWDVLSDVADRLDLSVDVETERQSVVLAPGNGDPAVARTTAGAFRVEVLSLRARRSMMHSWATRPFGPV